VRKKTNYWLCQ